MLLLLSTHSLTLSVPSTPLNVSYPQINPKMSSHDANKSPSLIAVATFLIPLTILALAMRFQTRYLSPVELWYDDYTALLALPFIIALLVLLVLEATHGLGKHSPAVSAGTAYFYRALSPELLIYHISVTLVKLSILLFYRGVFPSRRFLVTLWMVAGVVVA